MYQKSYHPLQYTRPVTLGSKADRAGAASRRGHQARVTPRESADVVRRARPASCEAAMPCLREKIPDVTLPADHLRWYGWQCFRVWSVIELCGHGIEGIPVSN